MANYSDILLTVDYDRTLTAPDASIPQANLDAIRKFMEEGGSFTINTGRSVPMATQLKDTVPVNAPLLLYNGSAAYDRSSGKLSQLQKIQLNPWATIAWCRENLPDLNVEVQGIDYHYRFEENPAWDAFCDYQSCPRAFAAEGADLGPFLKFSVFGKLYSERVTTLFDLSLPDIPRIDQAETLLREHFSEHCEIFRAGPRILDLHAKGVSKGHAARRLQKTLGKKYLVCVGDAHNDISMLDMADFAYCPSDSYLAGRYESVCPCGEGAIADVILRKIPEI